MTITEKIDNYLEEASANNVKNRIETALHKINFPFKSVEGTKGEVSVYVNKKIDTTSPEWAKLEKSLESIVSKLAKHNIIPDETVVSLSI